MACFLDRLIAEREQEKRAKYQELAADLAVQWNSAITVIPVVLGNLGRLVGLRHHLTRANLFEEKDHQPANSNDAERDAVWVHPTPQKAPGNQA